MELPVNGAFVRAIGKEMDKTASKSLVCVKVKSYFILIMAISK